MNSNIKININLIFIVLFIIISFGCISKQENQEYITVIINGKEINVEVADIDEKKESGLSGRMSLPENKGMLFMFQKPDIYYFHMFDMQFPLDFIWIINDEVVEISENISELSHQPPDYLIPEKPVSKVLEVNAGFINKNNIKIGDKVEIK